MTFARPDLLWLLLLGLPIILMHFYRGRIRRLQVPTLLFWEQVLVVEERASALKRLRHFIGLLIALASLAVLVSIVADPTLRGFTPEPRRFVLVVDTSPEMMALEPDGTPRITQARERAREFLSRLGRRDIAALLDGAGIVEPSTDSSGRRLKALERLPRKVDPVEPALLIQAARAVDPAALIVVITSRAWPEKTALLPIGTPRPNTGLTAPSAHREEGRIQLRATAVNASDAAASGTLEIRNRGKRVSIGDVTLAPRERRPVSIAIDKIDEEAFLEMRLKTGDAIPDDDVAAVIVPSSGVADVFVVAEAEPDPHLWSALELLVREGSIRVAAMRPSEFAAKKPDLGSVAIFDRVAPKNLDDGSFLLVGAGTGAPVPKPRIVDWDRETPIHRWVDYSDVICRQARIVTGPALIQSDQGPVASWGRRHGQAWIKLGFVFDVNEMDFALKPSFPIFLKNAIHWLAGEGRHVFPATCRKGSVLRNVGPLETPDAEFRVTEATAAEPVVRVHQADSGEVRIPAARAGLLKLECKGRTDWVAVEGDEPIDVSRVPPPRGSAMPDRIPWLRDLPYAPVASAIVLLLLLIEWALYQRGWL